jgi:hypothetical protein
MGVEEKRLPVELRDRVIKKSRKGPIGAIVVREFSGLESSVATKTVRKFEENITGGREDICEKLEAVADELRPEQLELLKLLRVPSKKSLAHLMAEAKVEPTSIMNAYARGAVALGKVQAAIIAHNGLPTIMKDLLRHAVDGTGVCTVCVGTGKVPLRKGGKDEGPCPMCEGVGKHFKSSEYKEFALQKLLEATRVIGTPGQTQVNVNQQVAVGGGKAAGFFEKMLETSDAILYPEQKKAEKADIVEAEVVDANS